MMDARTTDENRLGGPTLDVVEVVVPNLHPRYSGGTAINRVVAPRLARVLRAAWLGRDKPDGIARLTLRGLWRLRRTQPPRRPIRIWHARRNDEMIAGLLLRALGWRFALIFGAAAQRRRTWITHALVGRMDAVIATSAKAASFLKRPATVIHHGVDAEMYRPPADRMAAWAATGLPGRYGIGCFGRVRKQKGTDVFVAAMCRLLPRYPDFTAVIIGQITPDQLPFAQKLKSKIAAAGLSDRIRILGELEAAEVPPWYGRISIYAFTSRNEGFGLTLVEAMAAGVAVVASRAGAAEIVLRDGDTGCIVPPGEVEALVAALEPLMREPARAAAMGARARAAAVAEHSIEAEVASTVKVYESLWAQAARRRSLPSADAQWSPRR